MGGKILTTILRAFSWLARGIFGLLPEDEELSKVVQRLWLFWVPPFAGLAFSMQYQYRHYSWVLLAVLAVIFFCDGLWGWAWGKKWLRRLGFYYLAVLAIGLVMNLGLADLLSPNRVWNDFVSGFHTMLILACFPLLWLRHLAGEIEGLPSFALILLAGWLTLALAWALGGAVRKRRKKKED